MADVFDNLDPRKLLYELRGVPEYCDFCQRKLPPEQLEPEEGGDWVCHDCMWRWEIDENAALKRDLASVTEERDADMVKFGEIAGNFQMELAAVTAEKDKYKRENKWLKSEHMGNVKSFLGLSVVDWQRVLMFARRHGYSAESSELAEIVYIEDALRGENKRLRWRLRQHRDFIKGFKGSAEKFLAATSDRDTDPIAALSQPSGEEGK